VPGIVIPEQIRARLSQAGEAGSQVGLDIAKEMIDAVISSVQGVYIMPLERFELVSELVPYIRHSKAK
jgi:hypothetical protein